MRTQMRLSEICERNDLQLKVISHILISVEAMMHPRCVGWGEMGLDYHYDNSPRAIQRDVFTRQLRQAVALGKALTIHTREAEDDTERILKAEVPQDHKVRFALIGHACDVLTRALPDSHTLFYRFA